MEGLNRNNQQRGENKNLEKKPGQSIKRLEKQTKRGGWKGVIKLMP